MKSAHQAMGLIQIFIGVIVIVLVAIWLDNLLSTMPLFTIIFIFLAIFWMYASIYFLYIREKKK